MTANSADAQKLWGWLGSDGSDGAGNYFVRQRPNDAGPVVLSDFLFSEILAGGSYTLPVTHAAITIAGSTVNLRRGLRLSVSAAAITIAAGTVGVKVGRNLAVTPASVTISGQTVALNAARRLAVTPDAVTITGSDVALTYTPGGASYTLAVDAGAASIAGQSVALRVSRRLSVDPAAVSIVGSDVGLTYSGGQTPPQAKGDDAGHAMRLKRPIVFVRPKVEVELEEALETLEDVRPSGRVSDNKKKVRKALQTVKAIEAPPSYASAITNIERNLKAVSRATAKHEGMMNALLTVAMEMQDLIAEMQRKRAEKRKRNMERILWLI